MAKQLHFIEKRFIDYIDSILRKKGFVKTLQNKSRALYADRLFEETLML